MTRSINARIAGACLPIAALLLMLAAGTLSSQTTPPARPTIAEEIWRFGAYGGAHWLGYSVDMGGLPGVPSCCPRYEKGSGNGLAFGVGAELPLSPLFAAGARVLFSTSNGSLTAEERELVTAGRDTVTAIFGHTIDVSQPAVGIELMGSFRATPELNVLAGMRGDLMLGGTYHQEERIITPETITFKENDQRIRMVYDGDIPQESALQVALVAGVRYDVALNSARTVLLAPEVQVWQGLNNLISGEAWKARGIRAGINLYLVERVAPPAPQPERSEPFQPRTNPK